MQSTDKKAYLEFLENLFRGKLELKKKLTNVSKKIRGIKLFFLASIRLEPPGFFPRA